MRELRLALKVRNNRLIERREALGLSAPKFAELIEVSYGSYVKLESLKLSPYGPNGLREIARKVAEYWGENPEELWPDAVLRVATPTAERRLDAEELSLLITPTLDPPLLPDRTTERREAAELLERAVGKLEERRRRVVLARIRGESFEEIASREGISVGRTQQLHATAIGSLRLLDESRDALEALDGVKLRKYRGFPIRYLRDEGK